jgi:Fe-S-cluster containining protein
MRSSAELPPARLAAGRFSDWLRAIRASLAGGPGMEVACGDCVGCCTSSYFIKVRAHETRALQRIGESNLEADILPDGSRLMGFAPNGHCHMFVDGGCSIYSDRPETCRTYDCRVYAAAGIEAGEGRTTINERIASWEFEIADDQERAMHRAVCAAASYLRQHPVRFPNGRIPSRPAEIAVLAIKSYEVFIDPPVDDREIVAGIIAAVRNFNLHVRREGSAMGVD